MDELVSGHDLIPEVVGIIDPTHDIRTILAQDLFLDLDLAHVINPVLSQENDQDDTIQDQIQDPTPDQEMQAVLHTGIQTVNRQKT